MTQPQAKKQKNIIDAWEKFLSQETMLSAGTYIDLDPLHNQHFLGFVKCIYIREVYNTFFEKILERAEAQPFNTSNVVISGTPGIGKTYFFLFMLIALYKKQKEFVFCIDGDFFLVNSTIQCLEQHELVSVTDAFIIRDVSCQGTVPFRPRGFNIFICSLNRRHYKHLVFPGILFMPPWTLGELNDLAKKIPIDNLQNCYYKWGGIPRMLIDCNSDDIDQDLAYSLKLPDVLTTLVERTTANAQTISNQDSVVAQKYTLIIPSADYKSFIYDWPSPYIYEKVRHAVQSMKHSFTHHVALLQHGNHQECGRLYQEYVERKFCCSNGKYYTLKKYAKTKNTHHIEETQVCYPEKIQYFSIGRKKVQGTETVNSIQSPNDKTIYIPTERNSETIDFVQPPYFFQVTIAEKHKFKLHGVEIMKKVFSNYAAKPWNFVLILPQSRESCYCYNPSLEDVVHSQHYCIIDNFSFNEEDLPLLTSPDAFSCQSLD